MNGLVSTIDIRPHTSIELIPISMAYNGGERLRLPGTGSKPEATVILSGECNVLLSDNQGRTTGVRDGSVLEEIPNAQLLFTVGALPNEQMASLPLGFYFSEDVDLKYAIEKTDDGGSQFAVVKFGKGYLVEINGTLGLGDGLADISGDGTTISLSGLGFSYSLLAHRSTGGEGETFNATNIPTSPTSTHRYTIDWDALAQGEEGVTVQLDSDGDGVFEESFTSDNELTANEFPGGGSDSDGDGAVDTEDNCPITPNPGQEDADGDNIGDACDKCPNDPQNHCGDHHSIPGVTGWGAMGAVTVLGALGVWMLRRRRAYTTR